MTHINKERLEMAQSMRLSKGVHDHITEGMCIMEAVSYVAGEKWSDSPKCACPVISAFLREWNDDLPDNERTHLLSDLIPMIVGTKADLDVEGKRSFMLMDWMFQSFAPTWLNLAGLTDQANMLSSVSEIKSFENLLDLRATLKSIRSDADYLSDNKCKQYRNATREAVPERVLEPALHAARRAAAEAGNYSARRAALCAVCTPLLTMSSTARRDYLDIWADLMNSTDEAAFIAVYDVAHGAAFASASSDSRSDIWEAAFEAASNALAETRGEVQRSAKELVTRMCETKL